MLSFRKIVNNDKYSKIYYCTPVVIPKTQPNRKGSLEQNGQNVKINSFVYVNNVYSFFYYQSFMKQLFILSDCR